MINRTPALPSWQWPAKKPLTKLAGLLIILVTCVEAALAQESSFRLKTRLPAVKKAGYYRINLAPAFTARAKADLSDVRLSDGSDEFVPYLKFVPSLTPSKQIAPVNSFPAEKARYVPIKLIHFKMADSPGHISHVFLNFEQAHHVDKIKIVVSDTIVYDREVNIRLNDTTHRSLNKQFLSNANNEFFLSAKSKVFDIEIADKDSLPLPVISVGAYQKERYLIARLDPHKSYYLLLSDPKAIAPSYGIKYFPRRPTGKLPQISHQNMSHNPAFRRQRTGAPEQNNYWIWITIAAAIGIVTASGYGVMEELFKRGEKKEQTF